MLLGCFILSSTSTRRTLAMSLSSSPWSRYITELYPRKILPCSRFSSCSKSIAKRPSAVCLNIGRLQLILRALESIQSLDPKIVFRAALHLPGWRKLRPDSNNNRRDPHLYDPVFFLLLFHFHLVLSHSRPSTPPKWIVLFRTNIVGLCIRVISSREAVLRELGLSQIALLYQYLMVS